MDAIKTNKSPQKYIKTLHEIVNDPLNSNIIAWTDNGRSFAIFDLFTFTTEILQGHFRHKNFASFVRQLNVYDFCKVRDTGDVWVYSHPHFVKDKPEMLYKVIRTDGKQRGEKEMRKVLEELEVKQKGLIKKAKLLEMDVEKINDSNCKTIEEIKKYAMRQFNMEFMSYLFVQELNKNPETLEKLMMKYGKREEKGI